MGAWLLMALLLDGEADLVLRGGHVWAGKGLPPATAVAVSGEQVVAVGTDAEITPLVGPRTRVVELGGRLVVPGFNDAHVHLLSGGFGLLSVDLRDAKDEAEMARRIGAQAATLPAGTWIREGNWDHEAWPAGGLGAEERSDAAPMGHAPDSLRRVPPVAHLPTRRSIDPVTPDHPVFVQRLDGHMALANSLALRLAGITRDTKDPEGGTIVRDASGEPTGMLKDNAQDLMSRVIPEPTREMNRRAARAALAEAARFGVTSIQDNSSIDALPTYQDLRAAGELSARIDVWRPIDALPHLVAAGVRSGLGDDWIRVGALKILSDGSMGAGTAAFFAPYADDPKTQGLLLYPPDELRRLILDADAAGFQLAVHAIGDRANALVLDDFAAAIAAHGPRDRRFRIEHAQAVRAADLARFKELGVVASIQPSHCIDDMRWAERRIGALRAHDAYRFASFRDAGVAMAFGTDWFVETLDPRVGLYAAITREYPEGGSPAGPAAAWHPEERITLDDALDAYTRGSAYAEFADDRKGTLTAGRLADLVVFAGDLFRMPPRQVLATPVDLTVVGGRVVFDRAAAER